MPYVLLALFFMALYASTTAALAKLMEPVIDDVFKNENPEKLRYIAGAVLLAFTVKGFATYGESVTMNYIGQSIITNIQKDLLAHLMYADLAYYHHRSSGKLISECTHTVYAMKTMVSHTLTSLGKDIFTVLGLIGVMFYQDFTLSLISFFIFPLALVPISRLGRRLRRVSGNTQKETGTFVSFLSQVFQGARLVKAYTMENLEKEKGFSLIQGLFKLSLKTGKIRALSSPIMETLGGIAIVIVISYGGMQVIQGNSTAGAFFSFITALLLAYEPLKRLANLNSNLQEGLAATQQIFKTLDEKAKVIDLPGSQPCVIQKGEVVFEKVSFSYQKGKKILSDISLILPQGKMVALVGLSGAGKSTVLNLIPRFYDIENGRLLIDGKDVQSYTLKSLRSSIGLVSQEIMLFDDTIKANIAYGKPEASEEEIIEAAKNAAAHEFILELPEQYETQVGESGVRLSGGQRQRISIARAMLKNPPLLLLDEATSSLDTDSEKQVQDALEELMKNKTTLVIAHRLSTIQKADIIYVLDKGQVIESGSHSTLLAQKGLYAQLCKGQLKQNHETF
jgi:subfamily B ATP-binding cassette protein MsbA